MSTQRLDLNDPKWKGPKQPDGNHVRNAPADLQKKDPTAYYGRSVALLDGQDPKNRRLDKRDSRVEWVQQWRTFRVAQEGYGVDYEEQYPSTVLMSGEDSPSLANLARSILWEQAERSQQQAASPFIILDGSNIFYEWPAAPTAGQRTHMRIYTGMDRSVDYNHAQLLNWDKAFTESQRPFPGAKDVVAKEAADAAKKAQAAAPSPSKPSSSGLKKANPFAGLKRLEGDTPEAKAAKDQEKQKAQELAALTEGMRNQALADAATDDAQRKAVQRAAKTAKEKVKRQAKAAAAAARAAAEAAKAQERQEVVERRRRQQEAGDEAMARSMSGQQVWYAAAAGGGVVLPHMALGAPMPTVALPVSREFTTHENGGFLARDALLNVEKAGTEDGLRGTVIIVMKQEQFTAAINGFFGMDFYTGVLNYVDPIRASGSDVYFVLPDVRNEHIHKVDAPKPSRCALKTLSDPQDAKYYDHLLCEFDDVILTLLWRDLLRMNQAVAFISSDKDLIKKQAEIGKFRELYDKLETQFPGTAVQVNLLKLSARPV